MKDTADKSRKAKSDKSEQAKREKQQRGRDGQSLPEPNLGVTPRAHMCCCSAHGRRESLVAGHSATLGAIVVVVPTMQAAVVGTRTQFRGAILLCSIHMLHGKSMLGVADVQSGLEAVDCSQIFRLAIRVKESG